MKPKLTLITLGYRLDNIQRLTSDIAIAIKDYLEYHEQLPIKLTWVLTIDAVHGFGGVKLSEDFVRLANDNIVNYRITAHIPSEPYDPVGINQVIKEQYQLNQDDNEFFLLLDDDNTILSRLFEQFNKYANIGKDVIVFNMINCFGNVINVSRETFDLLTWSLDPSKTAFNYNIYRDKGPISNELSEECMVYVDSGLFNPDDRLLYDITWYSKLADLDRVVFETNFQDNWCRHLGRPTVTHNYYRINEGFDKSNMQLVILKCYDDKTAIAKIVPKIKYDEIIEILNNL